MTYKKSVDAICRRCKYQNMLASTLMSRAGVEDVANLVGGEGCKEPLVEGRAFQAVQNRHVLHPNLAYQPLPLQALQGEDAVEEIIRGVEGPPGPPHQWQGTILEMGGLDVWGVPGRVDAS